MFYTDATISSDFDKSKRMQAFLTINNLFDRDPPIIPAVTSFVKPTSDAYDNVGRFFTLGLRVKL